VPLEKKEKESEKGKELLSKKKGQKGAKICHFEVTHARLIGNIPVVMTCIIAL
jgi:hypothetical protein